MLQALRKYLTGWLMLMLAGMAIVWQAEFTPWDVNLADYYFDFKARVFPLKHAWFYKDFLHGLVKQCLIGLDIGLLLLIVFDYLKVLPLDTWSRLRLRFVFLASMLISLTIAGLKSFSPAHCPWDIERYAGTVPLQTVFSALFNPAPLVEAGHCFPAGHASTGLWLAAFCVFYLPDSPKKAVSLFVSGLSVGLLLGWGQQVRGAHFLSHTLVSAWIASAIILLLLAAFDRQLCQKTDQF